MKKPGFLILLSAALLLVTPVPAFSADHEPAVHEEAAVVAEAASPDDSSAAFLLVIPGSTLVGAGVGMATGVTLPGVLVGAGVGMVIWGGMVHFR